MKTIHQLIEQLLFENPQDFNVIQENFKTVQHQQYLRHLEWNIDSSRQKLIAEYWFGIVPKHFLHIISIAIILTIPFLSEPINRVLPGIFITTLLSFISIVLFIYLPTYFTKFLPNLETIAGKSLKKEFANTFGETIDSSLQNFRNEISSHELKLALQRIELETLQKENSVCRKMQFQNFTLALIFFAMAKDLGSQKLAQGTEIASSLQKLFGVSAKDLREHFDLINGLKRDKLKGRKITEARNRFEEAITFLEEIGCHRQAEFLHTMSLRFFSNIISG